MKAKIQLIRQCTYVQNVKECHVNIYEISKLLGYLHLEQEGMSAPWEGSLGVSVSATW